MPEMTNLDPKLNAAGKSETQPDWTERLTAGELLALKVYEHQPHTAGDVSVESLLRTIATLRALVEEYRAKLEARRTYYMASPYADNTIEIATLGWALAELNALKESDMQAKE